MTIERVSKYVRGRGHIVVLGGPYVARGPDVAQACLRYYLVYVTSVENLKTK